MTSEIPLPVRLTLGSIISIWVLALIGGVLVGVFTVPALWFSWLSIVLAGCIIATFVAQLATREKTGFIQRVTASIVGAFVVLAVVSGVLALLVIA